MNYYADLENFIYEHKDWESLLSAEPFAIKIKNDSVNHPTWYLFKYTQFDTDFSYDLCKACRGIVLDIKKDTDGCVKRIYPVCVPYQKFFNYREPFAEKLDWNKQILIENKSDGNLIKLSRYEGKLHWFTNGSLDTNFSFSEAISNDAIVDDSVEPETKNCKTFQDLIDYTIKKHNAYKWLETIKEGTTYMFELIGPRNRIIVPYKETDLILHGIYHHEFTDPLTWHEELPTKESSPFTIPERYDCKTIDETIKMLKDWKGDKEGIVACELPSFKRIKIKSDFYLSLKYIKGENGFTPKAIYNAILDGSADDALSAWPDISESVDKMRNKINELNNFFNEVYKQGIELKGKTSSKKEFAELAKKTNYANLLFDAYSGKPMEKKLTYDKFTSWLKVAGLDKN